MQMRRRIPTHADRDVSPFPLDQVKVVVLDEWPLFSVMQVCDATVGRVADIPHWRCCIGSDDQKQTAVIGISGQVLFGQFVFAFPCLCFYQGRAMLVAKSSYSSGEGASHVAQMIIVECPVIPMKPPPPRTHATAGLSHRKVGIDNQTIYAVVATFKQISVIVRKLLICEHRKPSVCQHSFTSRLFAAGEPHFPSLYGKMPRPLCRSLHKGLEPTVPKTTSNLRCQTQSSPYLRFGLSGSRSKRLRTPSPSRSRSCRFMMPSRSRSP